MTFADHLSLTRGDCTKAMRSYKRERRWGEVEWYDAWHRGLASEVEAAVNEYNSPRGYESR